MSLTGLISGTDVSNLDQHSLAKVINTLLITEVSANNVPLTALDISARIHDPDGGVDAYVDWPIGPTHEILGPGRIAIQFKSGKITKAILAKEFTKKGVQTTLKGGGRYLLLVGHDYNGPQVDKFRTELDTLCRNRRIPKGRSQVLFGSKIAIWIARNVSVLILVKGYPAFSTVETWLRHPDLQNPWKADRSREELLTTIRSFLGGQASADGDMIRVEGPAGVGKTRLVLEAVNQTGFAERTIFAPNAADPSVQQLIARIQSDPKASTTAVLDECTREQQSVLKSYVDLSGGRLRLICIGPADVLGETSVVPTAVFLLMPLSKDKIDEILADAFATVPREVRETAQRLSSGYVKLALFIARILAQRRDISSTDLLKIASVQDFLKRFVKPSTRRSVVLPTNLDSQGLVF